MTSTLLPTDNATSDELWMSIEYLYLNVVIEEELELVETPAKSQTAFAPSQEPFENPLQTTAQTLEKPVTARALASATVPETLTTTPASTPLPGNVLEKDFPDGFQLEAVEEQAYLEYYAIWATLTFRSPARHVLYEVAPRDPTKAPVSLLVPELMEVTNDVDKSQVVTALPSAVEEKPSETKPETLEAPELEVKTVCEDAIVPGQSVDERAFEAEIENAEYEAEKIDRGDEFPSSEVPEILHETVATLQTLPDTTEEAVVPESVTEEAQQVECVVDNNQTVSGITEETSTTVIGEGYTQSLAEEGTVASIKTVSDAGMPCTALPEETVHTVTSGCETVTESDTIIAEEPNSAADATPNANTEFSDMTAVEPVDTTDALTKTIPTDLDFPMPAEELQGTSTPVVIEQIQTEEPPAAPESIEVTVHGEQWISVHDMPTNTGTEDSTLEQEEGQVDVEVPVTQINAPITAEAIKSETGHDAKEVVLQEAPLEEISPIIDLFPRTMPKTEVLAVATPQLEGMCLQTVEDIKVLKDVQGTFQTETTTVGNHADEESEFVPATNAPSLTQVQENDVFPNPIQAKTETAAISATIPAPPNPQAQTTRGFFSMFRSCVIL